MSQDRSAQSPHGIYSPNSNELALDRFPTRHPPFMVLTKPWGGCYAGTVKPLRVSLVEPVAYLKSELSRHIHHFQLLNPLR